MPSETGKQLAIEALQTLLDDATIDDAIERLCLKVECVRACAHSTPSSGYLYPFSTFSRNVTCSDMIAIVPPSGRRSSALAEGIFPKRGVGVDVPFVQI